MNILVTIDRNYLPHFATMLYSLLASNPTGRFSIYVMNSTLTEDDLAYARRIIGNRGEIHLVRVVRTALPMRPPPTAIRVRCTIAFLRRNIFRASLTACFISIRI